MSKYRIVSQGGKFYIQEYVDVGVFRKRMVWSNILATYWLTPCHRFKEPLSYDSQEEAEQALAKFVEDDKRAAEPFHVVKEV